MGHLAEPGFLNFTTAKPITESDAGKSAGESTGKFSGRPLDVTPEPLGLESAQLESNETDSAKCAPSALRIQIFTPDTDLDQRCGRNQAKPALQCALTLHAAIIRSARGQAAQIMDKARSSAAELNAAALESARNQIEREQIAAWARQTTLRANFIWAAAEQIIELVSSAAAEVTGWAGVAASNPAAAAAFRTRVCSAINSLLPDCCFGLAVNPKDLPFLSLQAEEAAGLKIQPQPGSDSKQFYPSAALPAALKLTADPAVLPGGAKLITDFGSIEINLRLHLAAVIAELRKSEQIQTAIEEYLESEDA